MIDNYDIIEPRADALCQSLRAFGYDLTTAVADLIDNSITAGAKNIYIDFEWQGKDSCIYMLDDGKGMNEEELINAMRPGSQNPLSERSKNDLGRFGLGLKTASFSQCKKLIVVSKSKECKVSARCWDLDYVNQCGEWRLIKDIQEIREKFYDKLIQLNSGTLVIWTKLDRIIGQCDKNNSKEKLNFYELASDVKRHLSMVFHRYLEGNKPLMIWVNGMKIESWDPFLTKEKATELIADESFKIKGKKIIVKPYVLPHHSKITKEIYDKAAGIRGWNEHQGFYVYRNKRMLVCGDWLGLGFYKEEHNKLARILIDLPNTMDSDWEIDVKKSKAKPPLSVKQDLKRIAKITRSRACKIYRHRGKVISRNNSAEYVYTWEQKVRHGKTHYSINRNHPLVKDLISLNKENKPKINALLKLVEETLPIPAIVLKNSEEPDNQIQPFEGIPKQMEIVLKEMYKSLINSGSSHEDVKRRLVNMEPFNLYMEVVIAFLDSIKEAK